MRARRDPLRELEQLVSQPEWGTRNIAEHLASHPDIGAEIGLGADQLAALTSMEDQDSGPLLGAILRRRRDGHQATRAATLKQSAHAAASLIGTTARWDGDRAELEVRVVLSGLLADGGAKYICFVLPEEKYVAIPRTTLMAVARASGGMPGLRVSVDEQALRFSWRDGKGGLRLWPQLVAPHERDRVLHVALAPPPPVVPATPVPVRSTPRPRRDRPMPLRIADILADIGL